MSDQESLSNDLLIQLRKFVDLHKKKPEIINHPQLNFFKTFIQSLGAELPTNEKAEPQSEESDLELDTANVIDADNDPPQPMGDSSLEPSEEQIDQAVDKRSEAMSEYRSKNYEKAIELYTESIMLDPTSAISYAKRAQTYIANKKPNACIRDCEYALTINPDSALAHKMRGRANQLLGNWEKAAKDLRVALKSDFDEEANEWLNEITPNVAKIEEHNRKRERKHREREQRERAEHVRRVREAQEAARRQREEDEKCHRSTGGNADGPCCGDGPCEDANDSGPAGFGQYAQFLNDPEVLKAFQDPEVAAAFKDVSSNPSNILKYQNNPKIMSVINKVAAKFTGGGGPGAAGMMGGLAGMMGGLGGMMGGMGGGAAPTSGAKPPQSDDFGLD